MKKTLTVMFVAALAITLNMLGASSANAISSNACNQGTFNAYHVHSADGNGLYKIGAVCHG